MAKIVDNSEREKEFFYLVVESYIRESKPISSSYLCEKYRLPYSSATVRHVLETLEGKGFLSHPHTSSGRVPTQKGFRCYVERLNAGDIVKDYPIDLAETSELDLDHILSRTVDVLAELSGYTSLLAITGRPSSLAGRQDRVLFRGARFMLEQPEFEDIIKLRQLFYALEVKINELHDLLFEYLDEKVSVLIGDEIGFDEISNCSLMISGAKEKDIVFSLGVLGPMRMNYSKTASCLYSIKKELSRLIERL